jgi:hypothetical protein
MITTTDQPRREGPVTATLNSSTINPLTNIEQRHSQRDEMIRAAEREFVAAVGRALESEETSTHRTCAVQWAQILDGLRATRA